MRVEYRKRFLKELAKIPVTTRERIEQFVFEECPNLDSIFESGKIEQMKGYPSHFKIRFGDYRVGLKIEDNVVNIERALHRKDIYRFFP